ncbi:hypothetical protein C8J56DRAFT_981802 [Mycena floridula]|nr:hypothetical protein C8J56DRAFT_981802 [Mycena floridula]
MASVLPLHAQDATNKPSGPLSARSAVSAFSNATAPAAQNLDAVIAELQQANHDVTHLYEGTDEDTDDETDHGQPRTFWKKVSHVRAELRHFLHIPAFHYTIIGMVLLDLLVVFVELVLALLNLPCYTEAQKEFFEEHGIDDIPRPANCKLEESTALTNADWFLWSVSVFLLSLFVIELILAGFAFGIKHFKKPIYFIDAVIVTASLTLEVYFKFGEAGNLKTAPSALIALRLWKIVRAVHAIAHSVELKNQTIIKQIKAAKANLEASYEHVTELLEQQEWKILYLRKRAPQVTDDELDHHVQEQVLEREKKESREEFSNEKSDAAAA